MDAPTDIRLRRGSRTLEVAFEGEEPLILPFEHLRVHSPSAEVQGHGPGQETLQVGKRDVGVESLEPVGNYALKIRFDDGHDTGLYTWDYLHELGTRRAELWTRYLDKLRAAGHDHPELGS